MGGISGTSVLLQHNHCYVLHELISILLVVRNDNGISTRNTGMNPEDVEDLRLRRGWTGWRSRSRQRGDG